MTLLMVVLLAAVCLTTAYFTYGSLLARLLGTVAAVLCALGSAPALAHTKSETHTVWQIVGSTVHLTFTMPIVEANRLALHGVVPPPNSRINYLGFSTSIPTAWPLRWESEPG